MATVAADIRPMTTVAADIRPMATTSDQCSAVAADIRHGYNMRPMATVAADTKRPSSVNKESVIFCKQEPSVNKTARKL